MKFKRKKPFCYSYTGKAPDAYFYVGTSGSPNEERGIRIQYPPGSNKTLGMKKGLNAVLTERKCIS